VKEVAGYLHVSYQRNFFTCRTSRQGSRRWQIGLALAAKLLHLPDEPAGVANLPNKA